MSSTQIMAILNLTPDSFSDGGQLSSLDSILASAETAITAGANILDIGGESTRPGAQTIPVEEEIRRVIPAIEALHKHFPGVPISIDTRKAGVAEAALKAGANIVNDVSGLQFDCNMAKTVAGYGAKLVIMHSQGTPETMQVNPSYPEGVTQAVRSFFERQIEVALSTGITRERIILDPGFGFGKTLRHNLELLPYIDELQCFGMPLLIGTSRKSFLTMNKDIPPQEREALTAATLALAISKGAGIVRVHDVVTQAPVVRLVEAILEAGGAFAPLPV